MHLIVGLGNPGAEYEDTRHNLGFLLVDRIAARLGGRVGRWEHQALSGRVEGWGTTVLLAKPQTFMNLSGLSVGPLARFYRVPPERMLVAYDDADLAVGALRLRAGGSAGGHRGMESVLTHLGTREVPRLRLGIGRPGVDREMIGHVLARFRKDEREAVDRLLEEGVLAVETFVREGIVAAMNRHNRKGEPPDPEGP